MNKDLSRYAPLVLRLAMAALYLWFGVSQVTNPAQWTSLVPAWATAPFGIDPVLVIHMNGWFEIAAGILLAIGIAVRPVALLLFLHMLPIAASLWPGSVAVRDFALTFATLGVALFGTDQYCYDPFKRKPAEA